MFKTPHISLFLLSGLALPGWAMPSDYQQDGLYGELQLLAGGLSARGNDIVAKENQRLDNNQNSNLNHQADGFNTGFILPNIELGYRFNQSQNDVFWRSTSEANSDFATNSEIGISHTFYTGITTSFVVSPAALGNGSYVWQDPFDTSNKRKDSQAETNGIGVDIDYLFNGKMSLSYRYLDTKIKKEYSGRSLINLSASDREKLKRDHTSHNIRAEFTQMLSQQTYLISDISFAWQQGKQNMMDAAIPGISLSLYHFNYEREYYAQLGYRNADYRNTHPLFNKKRDDHDINLTAGIRFHQLIHDEWVLDALVSSGKNNSNINFYDKSYNLIAVGVSREF